MTRVALLLEIEEVVFDTLAMRARALHEAIRNDGVVVSRDEVRRIHAGATARMALDTLPEALSLDAVSRDLVLRRALDAMRVAMDEGLPSFDCVAADAVRRLAIDWPLAVVTRGTREDAQRLLEHAGLDAFVRSVHSLDDLTAAEQPEVWTRATARMHGLPTIAVGPRPILAGAQLAGLHTIAIATTGFDSGTALVSLAQLDASFFESFPEFRESS